MSERNDLNSGGSPKSPKGKKSATHYAHAEEIEPIERVHSRAMRRMDMDEEELFYPQAVDINPHLSLGAENGD